MPGRSEVISNRTVPGCHARCPMGSPPPFPYGSSSAYSERMFIGLDLGTSSLKAALVDREEGIIATASERLAVSRPGPDRSEQDPQAWWQAAQACLDQLATAAPSAMAQTRPVLLP